MTSITHGANMANQRIAELRDGEFDTEIADGQEIMPGVFFSFDPAGVQQGHLSSAAGAGLNIKIDVEQPGNWLALHIALGDVDLTDTRVVGLYSENRAPRAMTYRVCIRSGRDDGFVDCFFDKDAVAYSMDSAHVDVLERQKQPNLPPLAPWRELILFFHVESFDLELHDLRVFMA